MTTTNWDSSKHPRDEKGQFTFSDGSSNTSKEEVEKAKMQRRADILYPTMKNKKVIENYKETDMIKRYENNQTEVFKQNLQEKSKEVAPKWKESDNLSNYTKPVEGKLTNKFGYRKPPIKGASKNHSGIDIAVPVGTPIKAIADGTVVAAREGMRGYGIGVFIDHGIINGKHVVSEYGHLSGYDVKIGDKIKKGQIFAKSGNTGLSTGPHLHLTIKENDTPVDPQIYIKGF